MRILDLFRRPKRNTAQLAKERLQIIVSHESARRTGPDVIRKMQQEILEVICRYVHIDQDKIKVQLERHGDQSVLELNVTLPDGKLMQLTPPAVPSKSETLSKVAIEKSEKKSNVASTGKPADKADEHVEKSSDVKNSTEADTQQPSGSSEQAEA